MRCPTPKSAKTFAVSAMNAIGHLKSKHNRGELIIPGPQPLQQTIERAFCTHKPAVTFNEDVFRQLLLRWIVKMNINHRVCEDESFRTYCSYLAACKPDYSAIHRAIPKGGHSIKWFLLSYHESRDEGRSFEPTPNVTLQNPIQLFFCLITRIQPI